MMKAMRLGWGIFLAGIAGAVLGGCEWGGSGETAGEEESRATLEGPSSPPLVYENGHALTEPISDPVGQSLESELLRLVNIHRVSLGLPALIDSPAVREAARGHARHMIQHAFVGHLNPEGDGAGARLTAAGIPWEQVGENLAAGYATPQEVFEAWMASPGHREILEGAEWTRAGVGYACDPGTESGLPYVHYWTMDFLK